jgi:hypothetical protein
MTLTDLILKAYREPDPKPYLFRCGQQVRVLRKVIDDGQTPTHWAGRIGCITRRYTTGIHKDHWYLVEASGSRCEFRESELDRRYVVKAKETQ